MDANDATSRVALVKPHNEAKLHLQGGALLRANTDVRQCGYGTAPTLPSTTFHPKVMLSPSSGEPATIVFGRAPTAAGENERRIALQISADGRTLTVYGGTIILDGIDLKAQCAWG